METRENGYYGIVICGGVFLGLYRYHGKLDYFDTIALWKQSKGDIDKFHELLKREGFEEQKKSSYTCGTIWFFEEKQLK
jgi:hypothetical protein